MVSGDTFRNYLQCPVLTYTPQNLYPEFLEVVLRKDADDWTLCLSFKVPVVVGQGSSVCNWKGTTPTHPCVPEN